MSSRHPAIGCCARPIIAVDLQADYTGVLNLDGNRIPEDQLDRIGGLNRISFTPGEGQRHQELTPGPPHRHRRVLANHRPRRPPPHLHLELRGPLTDSRGNSCRIPTAIASSLNVSGSSPVSRRASKAFSSRMGTPSSSALVSLAWPGSAPTTTAVVFFDTLPGDLPPRTLIASSAASRDRPSSVPVTTIDMPAKRLRHVRRFWSNEVQARGAQLLDDAAVRLVGEPRVHTRCDRRADALDGRQLVLGRIHNPIEMAELPGQRHGGCPADVRGCRGRREIGQRPILGPLDRVRGGW